MNHEQAMLMKSSRVSDLNTPWEQVLHLASRRVFPKRHTIDVSNTESPYFYYILSGTVRLAYVGANGEERTILYAGAGTLMNVPTIIAGDIKNTVVTCTERVVYLYPSIYFHNFKGHAPQRPQIIRNSFFQ